MTAELKQALKQSGLGFLNLGIAVALVIVLQVTAHKHIPDLSLMFLSALLVAAVYLVGYRLIERRLPSELVGSGWLREFTAGVGVGVCLFSTVMLLLWPASVYHPAGWGSASLLGAGAIAALSEGVIEEVLFRGFLFRLIDKVAGTWWALLTTSALFGAAHAFNPGATIVSSLAIALEAGVLLGAAYSATGRLWLPIGLHAAWNFTEGSVFGMSVSGLGAAKGLILGSLTGSAILTGGKFGPEASIVAVLVCLAAAVFFLRRMIVLGRVHRPGWSQSEGVVHVDTDFRVE